MFPSSNDKAAFAGLVLAACVSHCASAAETGKVQMLHWWTSGGEAAALQVLKNDPGKAGTAWEDVPVAGGSDGAMTALKAIVAAGNDPTALQMLDYTMLDYTMLDYAQAGKMGNISEVARKDGWDRVVPAPLKRFAVYNGKWIVVPVDIHGVNWLWINKAGLAKIGGMEPQSVDELFACSIKRRRRA